MRVSAVLFLGMGIACAADRCSPPPELASFIGALPVNDNRALREAIEERLKQTPGEFTLHRMFVDASVYEKKPVRDRYQRLLESHTDSLDYQYLQARTLVGSNTKQALQIYARILEKDPDYPWVHLSQLEIYHSQAFRDRTKLQTSFLTIQRVCPSLLRPYAYLNDIPNLDITASTAVTLRKLLQEAKTAQDLRLYSTLWAVEFRLRPTSEHDDERKQVAEDLKRLLPFESDLRLQSAITDGARMTGDKSLEQRMMAAHPERDPLSLLVQESNAWLNAHPRPKPGDSAEIRHAYGRELLAKSEEWRTLAPRDDYDLDRVRALIYLDAAPDQIGRAADYLLALVRARGGLSVAWIVELAVTLFDGGVLLDRIEPLCSEAISLLDDPEAIIEVDLAPSSGHTSVNRQRLVNEHAQALLLLARFYEKQSNRDKAHLMLWQASDYLSARAPAAGETNTELLRTYSLGRYRVLRERAEMAEREGRKLDALNGYRDALAAFPINRLELGDRQHKLWKELGGTEEGWQQWTNPIVPDKNEKPAPVNHEGSAEKRKLPPLVARDIEGNQWTLDRFAGKTVVAVVWATWCEPCRAELPYFAKLTDRVKERSDVLAISFNTDDNIAIAQAFAKSRGYSFPILAAKQYAQDLMPTLAIPRTWIIRDGTIVKEYYGFGPDGDKWVEEILADLPK